mmetsp:Transcript_30458/g.37495  ORF Transcript_30458/g.37495 Transcript_30458/m.37495 type:complete len:320 (-) Transcript_30458:991-1950(-)
MLHTSEKDNILESWKKHRFSLLFSMLGMGDLMIHIEPILLIADYYGEKQAMYFTFLIHHISMLCIPAFFGLILWGYHFYLAAVYEPKEGEYVGSFVDNYFAILDTRWNYPYLCMTAVWSTIYIESWKRKQNTVKFYWASDERKSEIMTGEKREQRGATYFIEKVSGKKTLSVLDETPVKNMFVTLILILLAMCVAWVIWYVAMKLLGKLMLEVDGLNDKAYKIPRLWISVITYSIAVIYFNRYFKGFVAKVVTAENLKYKKEHEESLIQKGYTLGFFNSYLGMSWAAFVDRKLANVCGLMLSVLMLKQIIMNLIDLWSP